MKNRAKDKYNYRLVKPKECCDTCAHALYVCSPWFSVILRCPIVKNKVSQIGYCDAYRSKKS